MLRNRSFWALIAVMVFLFAQVIFPDLPFTEDQSVAFVVMVAAYMVGEGLEGKRIIENIGQLVKSRKFLATVAGLVVVIVQAYFPEFKVTADHLTEFLVIAVGIVANAGIESYIKRDA